MKKGVRKPVEQAREENRLHMRRYMAENREQYNADRRAYYAANKEKWTEMGQRYIEKIGRNVHNKRQRQNYAKHAEKRREGARRRRAETGNKVAITRKFSEQSRTLSLDDHFEFIEKIFMSRPVRHHIDHVVPLRGVTPEGYKVSGLHVPWNYQYLLEDDNLQKNRWMRDADLAFALTPRPVLHPSVGRLFVEDNAEILILRERLARQILEIALEDDNVQLKVDVFKATDKYVKAKDRETAEEGASEMMSIFQSRVRRAAEKGPPDGADKSTEADC